jgi:hypothetical protein
MSGKRPGYIQGQIIARRDRDLVTDVSKDDQTIQAMIAIGLPAGYVQIKIELGPRQPLFRIIRFDIFRSS